MSSFSLPTDDEATKRWWLVVKRTCLLALIALGAPLGARGETIYVSSYELGQGENRLHRFDSAAPGVVLEAFEINPPLPYFSVEFDQATGELYAFEHYNCSIPLCPYPYFDVAVIDPFTGQSTILETSGLEQFPFRDTEADIQPVSREIRYFPRGLNAHISLSTLELQVDAGLNEPANISAVAHAAAVGGGIETFAIASASWLVGGSYALLRVGGPGGVPPASSGEVTTIGQGEVVGLIRGFDVSANGTAYLVTMYDYDAPDGYHVENRLYTIDLATGASQEVGMIAMPIPYSYVNGIAVAPPGLTSGAPEIPVLSHIGLATLSLLLASTALWRSRSNPSRVR